MADLSPKELFEYHKDLHYKELDRTDKLYAMTQLPVTLVSALSLVFLYYLNKLPGLAAETTVLLFWVFFATGSFCLLGAIVNIVWTERPPRAPKLLHWPDVEQINQYLQALRRRNYPDIEARFYRQHSEMLRLTVKANFSRNKARDVYRHSAVSWVLLALALYSVAIFPHRTIRLQEKPQLIQIVNPQALR